MTPVTRRAAGALFAALAAAPFAPPAAAADPAAPHAARTRHRVVEANGARVFYREAGPADAPAVLLLHGFPTSSHMFRDLIPILATRHRVVAPDLPGFGLTETPAGWRHDFATLAETVEAFTDAVGLDRFAVYVFDYGAPTAFRLALKRPEKIAAIISQNGNAYEEGLTEAWSPIQAYWREPTPANRDALRQLLTLEVTRWQYEHGAPDPTLIAPEAWLLDQLGLDRPGAAEIQLDLFRDYASNVALYPAFQRWFREARPPLLAVWGRNDPFFGPAGAEAYRRDLPEARVVFYDAGHFALETHAAEIGAEILRFLG